jgi:hypothetical protein
LTTSSEYTDRFRLKPSKTVKISREVKKLKKINSEENTVCSVESTIFIQDIISIITMARTTASANTAIIL